MDWDACGLGVRRWSSLPSPTFNQLRRFSKSFLSAGFLQFLSLSDSSNRLPFILPRAHVKALGDLASLAHQGHFFLTCLLVFADLGAHFLGSPEFEFDERACAYLVVPFELLCSHPLPVSAFLKSRARFYACRVWAGKRRNGGNATKYSSELKPFQSFSIPPVLREQRLSKVKLFVFVHLLIHSATSH